MTAKRQTHSPAFQLRLKSREQCLRFRDLGKFRRRHKTFERGREHGMGIGGAVGVLIKRRQRQRRAQFKTPRLLLLRDGDGGGALAIPGTMEKSEHSIDD
jgi:hypothetical protein